MPIGGRFCVECGADSPHRAAPVVRRRSRVRPSSREPAAARCRAWALVHRLPETPRATTRPPVDARAPTRHREVPRDRWRRQSVASVPHRDLHLQAPPRHRPRAHQSPRATTTGDTARCGCGFRCGEARRGAEHRRRAHHRRRPPRVVHQSRRAPLLRVTVRSQHPRAGPTSPTSSPRCAFCCCPGFEDEAATMLVALRTRARIRRASRSPRGRSRACTAAGRRSGRASPSRSGGHRAHRACCCRGSCCGSRRRSRRGSRPRCTARLLGTLRNAAFDPRSEADAVARRRLDDRADGHDRGERRARPCRSGGTTERRARADARDGTQRAARAAARADDPQRSGRRRQRFVADDQRVVTDARRPVTRAACA